MSLLQQVEECFSVDDERVWSTYTQENKERNLEFDNRVEWTN